MEQRPARELKLFAQDEGTWDAEILTRPAPGAPGESSRGVQENSLACGGRWLVTTFHSRVSGFEGHGIQGWDVMRRAYTSVWVDPTRTTLSVMSGEVDPASGVQVMVGEMRREDGVVVRWRELTERPDRDTRITRTFVPLPTGHEHETMVVTFRRRREG